MKLQTVSNRKLYLQIADQIRDQILSGEASHRQQLPSERDLAISLGVSRPTVREALIALEVAGLLEVRVGVGAFVLAPGKSNRELPDVSHSPVEVMAARRTLEPETAALASQNIDAAGKFRLAGTVRQMRAETDAGQWSSESDRALHMTLAENCGNAVLRELLETLWAFRSEAVDKRFHRHLADIVSLREHIMDDHERIANAVIAGDATGARAAMAAHLEFVEKAMLDVWD
ncbi:MAG TPA: FadR/GntR family transcriptional regulator [Rhizobiaceae bacterium]|nr:FadR/GntR family transcriptional regulator [Rhizobiaceae bacterium]